MLGKGDEDHTIVHQQLIKEFKGNKETYTRLYGSKQNYDTIYESLIPCINGPAPEDKWMCCHEMGHLIASAYEKMCVDLTRYGSSKHFLECTLLHLQIQMIVLCVSDGFQNHDTLFKFI